MPDKTPQKSKLNVIPSGDYKSADPAAVTLVKGDTDELRITLTVTLQSGAGNTLTVTATDADTTAVLATYVFTAAGTYVKRLFPPTATRRVTLTPVGTGTRTTLTYAVDHEWADLPYAHGVYWDGTKYASNEAVNP